jgi:hypothetical protein
MFSVNHFGYTSTSARPRMAAITNRKCNESRYLDNNKLTCGSHHDRLAFVQIVTSVTVSL